ncbi:hypothetical protein [Herbiconiux sp. A18JL235]|uniref:Uncharacterized protein n=1 Tax=Herbiconiux sp. A18JL235 TaxID=3152363 RepID=A0AB39BMX8_9MICO
MTDQADDQWPDDEQEPEREGGEGGAVEAAAAASSDGKHAGEYEEHGATGKDGEACRL